MCKANYAVYVKRTTPVQLVGINADVANDGESNDNNHRPWWCERLDILAMYGVIIFTDADAQNIRSQDSGPSSDRYAQPAIPGRPRCTVPGKGILRCSRSGSGQVRNVASCQHGGAFNQPGGNFFRFLSFLLLPNPNSIRSGRGGRAGSPKAPPQTNHQTTH